MISRNISSIKVSATLEIAAKARMLQSQGKDVISLSIGEPDFHTPEDAKRIAKIAIDDSDDNYPPVNGNPALINAIIKKFKSDNGIDYNPNQIIVSNGAKQILFNAFFVLLNRGDEVLLPAPYWVSYSDVAKIAGGNPIIAPGNKDFTPNISTIRNCITDKTKILVINSPNNPSGVCYSKEELLQIAEILRENPGIFIISDDIYEHIIYGEKKFYNILDVAPELKDRAIVVNGISKCYAMTGWRLGYCGCGDPNIIKFMSALQSQSTGGVCSIAQKAAIGALNGKQDILAERCSVFKKRRDIALKILSRANGMYCARPDGAFYLFPSCEKLIGRKTLGGLIIKDDTAFAEYLLENYLVSVVPGVEFGMPGHFRISYALAENLLEKACNRIVEAYNSII